MSKLYIAALCLLCVYAVAGIGAGTGFLVFYILQTRALKRVLNTLSEPQGEATPKLTRIK